MKAMRFVLVILTSTAVAAFYAVPSAPSRHHAATSRTRFSLRADRIASRTTAVRMSVSTGSQELPRLPPGDDSKGGDAQSVSFGWRLLWPLVKTIWVSFWAQLLT